MVCRMLRVIAAVAEVCKTCWTTRSNTRCRETNLPERAGQQHGSGFSLWLTPESHTTADHMRIFERLPGRCRALTRSRRHGSWLGHCQHLMEVHGGRLWVEVK